MVRLVGEASIIGLVYVETEQELVPINRGAAGMVYGKRRYYGNARGLCENMGRRGSEGRKEMGRWGEGRKKGDGVGVGLIDE